MKTAHFRFKIAAVAVLMSGVGLFAGSLSAAAAVSVVLPTATPATNALSSGSTQAVQTATNALPGTNIFSGQLTLTNAFIGTATVFTVPAGKRLVIQFVSAVATLPSSQVLLSLTVDGLQTIPYFTGNRLDGTAIFVVSQKLRDFLGPGQSLVVSAERSNSSGEATWFVNVIGELEDVGEGNPKSEWGN